MNTNVAAQGTGSSLARSRRRMPPELNIFLVLIGIALVYEVLGWLFVGQSFLMNSQRLTIMILQVSVIGIIAVGVTQVIITGGIDLSSGSVVGMTAMISASVAQASTWPRALYPSLTDLPAIVPIGLGVGIGLLAGFINGQLIARTRFRPSSPRSHDGVGPRCLQVVHEGSAGLGSHRAIQLHRHGHLAGDRLPRRGADIPHRAALHPLRQIHLRDRRQCPGRARLRHQCRSPSGEGYAIAGMLAGLAGVVTAARAQTAQAGMGVMYELDAIAATVIGGTSLTGGVGRVTGTVIGTVILGVMTSGFTFLRVDAYYQEIVKGIIIVAAVVVDVYRQKGRKKT